MKQTPKFPNGMPVNTPEGYAIVSRSERVLHGEAPDGTFPRRYRVDMMDGSVRHFMEEQLSVARHSPGESRDAVALIAELAAAETRRAMELLRRGR